MKGIRDRLPSLLLALGLGLATAARAEIADVYLKSGLKLRGDVTRDGTDIVVSNAAGEVRLAQEDVLRVVPLAPPSQPAPPTSAAVPAPASPRTTTLPTSGPASSPASRPADTPPAPPVSERDIQRLKIGELKLDGAAEAVRVRYLRKGRQRDLWLEVLDQLKRSGNYRSEWEDVLTRGRPHEKLQLIARQTGLEHIDRIEIENDPAVFDTFRRRVLPLVVRGCARSGCHGGRTARLFRFPQGSTPTDEYTYTNFALLDQLETEHGPLLDRTNPERSVLLDFMLPQEDNPRAHPDVGKGPSFRPVLRDPDDRNYAVVLDWINSLAIPHPDYQLEYRNPYAGRLAPLTPEAKALPPEPEPDPETEPQAEFEQPAPSPDEPADMPPQTRPSR